MAGGLDKKISRGLFQPTQFHDFVILPKSVTQNHSLTTLKGLGTAKNWMLLEKGMDESISRGFLCPHQREKEHWKSGLDEGTGRS